MEFKVDEINYTTIPKLSMTLYRKFMPIAVELDLAVKKEDNLKVFELSCKLQEFMLMNYLIQPKYTTEQINSLSPKHIVEVQQHLNEWLKEWTPQDKMEQDELKKKPIEPLPSGNQ